MTVMVGKTMILPLDPDFKFIMIRTGTGISLIHCHGWICHYSCIRHINWTTRGRERWFQIMSWKFNMKFLRMRITSFHFVFLSRWTASTFDMWWTSYKMQLCDYFWCTSWCTSKNYLCFDNPPLCKKNSLEPTAPFGGVLHNNAQIFHMLIANVNYIFMFSIQVSK